MLSDKGLAQWEVASRSDLGINNKNFSEELKVVKCFFVCKKVIHVRDVNQRKTKTQFIELIEM